jgi:hypothetical protein
MKPRGSHRVQIALFESRSVAGRDGVVVPGSFFTFVGAARTVVAPLSLGVDGVVGCGGFERGADGAALEACGPTGSDAISTGTAGTTEGRVCAAPTALGRT